MLEMMPLLSPLRALVLAVSTLPAVLYAQVQAPPPPEVAARNYLLIDVTAGQVLAAKDVDAPIEQASLTKLMTAYLVFDALQAKKITLEQRFPVSERAWKMPGSRMFIDPKMQVPVDDLLKGMIVQSGNDATVALAEGVGGTVERFVELMNQRAAQLGCKNTHFNNPNGLPDETHYTTAGDMMKIAKAAWYNPRFRKFVTTQVYEIPPTNKQSETRYLLNHHKMMPGQSYAYDGVLGGKTGYTDAAGSTLVTYAKRGNSILIAVVLNSTNGAFPDTTSLLDYGFDNFEKVDLNIDTDPVPAAFLPCEKHLLKDWNNLCSFYYMRHVYVTVPTGTDVSQLVKKQKLLNNSVGPKRIKSKYYLDGHMVGYGMQYEKEILSDLLLNASF